jgi:hypothetical protein
MKMRKEAELFDNFSLLTTAPDKEDQLTLEIVKILGVSPNLQKKPPLDQLINLCTEYRDSTFHEPLNISDIDSFNTLPISNQRDAAMELLKKIGRNQVLDISKEISLLREVKDIQDELGIMSVLFDNQKKVMTTLERIILSKGVLQPDLQELQQRNENTIEELPENLNTIDVMDTEPLEITSLASTDQAHQDLLMQTELGPLGVEEENDASSSTKRGSIPSALPTSLDFPKDPSTQTEGGLEKDKAPIDASDSNLERQTTLLEVMHLDGAIIEEQRASRELNTRSDHKQLRSPLAVVETSIEETSRMLERAWKANQAVSDALLPSNT